MQSSHLCHTLNEPHAQPMHCSPWVQKWIWVMLDLTLPAHTPSEVRSRKYLTQPCSFDALRSVGTWSTPDATLTETPFKLCLQVFHVFHTSFIRPTNYPIRCCINSQLWLWSLYPTPIYIYIYIYIYMHHDLYCILAVGAQHPQMTHQYVHKSPRLSCDISPIMLAVHHIVFLAFYKSRFIPSFNT